MFIYVYCKIAPFFHEITWKIYFNMEKRTKKSELNELLASNEKQKFEGK